MSKKTFSSGTVSISFKRYNEGVNCFPSKKAEVVDVQKNRCLIRAVYKNTKISTIVSLKDVVSFNASISSALRGSVTFLERKQKKTKLANSG
ncbi:hypothetical protein JH06_0622 [Blastocystis sp. subtype 4]|uniref:hypothetical protein n=1 Tax=Blastocystis sp. subtype 4 TaxID=944170 RepID=UPI000711C21B|nr:hypothetical protein JH06_0622 [Blastocystis sp. subtype 4]KNB46747.1 hypothetical protein JH06_0622 [Blastocystis sp. subtype 4]|eukprot:XP_014530190.1 hypothetical protein JH06_0622 [Blastocystis sp. subtype 4]